MQVVHAQVSTATLRVSRRRGRQPQFVATLQPESAELDRLRADLGVSNEELADILGIPTRTLARRTDRFKPSESERLLRIGSAWAKALAVLEEPSAARRWMTQPKRALGGLTPLRCCDTEIGAREVESLLGRIEHGVFS